MVAAATSIAAAAAAAPATEPPRRGYLARCARAAYGRLLLLTARSAYRRVAQAAPDSALGTLTATTPSLWELAIRPFVSATWSSQRRLARMIGHCDIVDRLGHPFRLRPRHYVELLTFTLENLACRAMLDQPSFLLSDGLLTLSLWVGIDRAFSLSFCLADEAGGRTAYVGGIQGRRHAGALDQNRALTKGAHGMRPQDLTFELFRMLAAHLGVTRIACVSNAVRYQNTRRAFVRGAAAKHLSLDYDKIWADRGGVLGPDEFFDVPVARQVRAEADIPAKKRTLYARRYALLDGLERDLAAAIRDHLPVKVHTD